MLCSLPDRPLFLIDKAPFAAPEEELPVSSYHEFRAQTRRRRRKRTFRRAVFVLILALILAALAWVITFIIQKITGEEAPQSGGASSSISAPASGSSSEGTGGAVQAGWNVVGPVEQTVDATITSPDYRMIALPENGRVDMSYFANTMIIGDSISQGFWSYNTDIKDIVTLCAYQSCGPDTIVNNGQLKNPQGERVPTQDDIAAKLAEKQPEHIYVLFGTNSIINLSDDAFFTYYEKMLDWLQSVVRPDAQIYIQSITPVTPEYEAERAMFTQDHLYQLNCRLAQMAFERGLYFLDLNTALAGDDGYLNPEYAAPDGHHLDQDGYRAWIEFMSSHTAYSPTIPYLLGSPYYQAAE